MSTTPFDRRAENRPPLIVRQLLLTAVTGIPLLALGSLLLGFGRALGIVAVAIVTAAGLALVTRSSRR
jgi:hypothetical protein